MSRIHRSSQHSSPTGTTALVAILTLLVLTPLARVFAQGFPAPPAPTTYPYDGGNLIVIEGIVHRPSTNPADDHQGWTRGLNAGVAIDDPGEGLARFLVGWESDTTEVPLGPPESLISIAVLANRFEADGECITWGTFPPNDVCGPKTLSTHHGSAGVNSWNFSLSMAMSSDATVRAAWVGHSIEGFFAESTSFCMTPEQCESCRGHRKQ